MSQMTEPQQYLTVPEAAKLMGVSVNTMRSWMNDGVIWSLKVPLSGYRRVPRSEIIRLLREQVSQVRLERKLKDRY